MLLPVGRGIAPAQSKEAVQLLLPALGRPVADCGKIRNQAEIPEQERDDEVSPNREYIPDQWTAKLWPKIHGIGIRKQVVEEPRPPEMQKRHQTGTGHRKQSHRFGKAIDC